MLESILLIFKIIGILFLVIFGFVIFILLLILFAPIKYKSNGHKYNKDLELQALITYLNPLVRIIVKYPSKTVIQVKILFLNVYTMKAKTGVTENTGDSENADKPNFSNETATAEKRNLSIETSTTEKIAASKKTIHENAASTANQTKEATSSKVQDNTKKETGTFDNIRFYAALLQENKVLILEALKTLIKALKTILPRKCYINAVYGTGQADTTGYLYAIYCALFDVWPKGIELILEPIWIEKKLEGEYSIKGKIRLIHLLIAAIKIIADKNIRQLYKKIRSV